MMKLYFDELPVGLRLSKCISEDGDTELVIPDGVTELAPGVLKKCCSMITRLVLPSTLKLFAADSFVTMKSLRCIDVASDHPDLISRDGILLSRDAPNAFKLLCYPAGRVNKAYVVPDDVEVIGSCAFDNAVYLEKVLLHERIREVGNYAFASCLALRYVQIDSKDLPQLSTGAFRFCKSLKTVAVRGKVSCIGDYAFDCCVSLENISFPEGLTHVGSAAFANCDRLETITLPHTVSYIGINVFYGTENLQRIYCAHNVARLISMYHDVIRFVDTFDD